MSAPFLTIAVLLSLLLPIINWALSLLFTRIQLPRAVLVLTEILLIATTLLAITVILLKYHLIVNRADLLTTFCFYCILFMVQVYYVRNYSKISYVFLTSVITLLLTLLANAIAHQFFAIMPIYWYYIVHLLVLIGWDDNEAMSIIRKQTWVNEIGIFDTILPKKNIGAYVLSSVASFCYSSLNLCVLLSSKTIGISEYIAFSLTIIILILTGSASLSLLVKHENIGDGQFPGCLLVHYPVQGYRRCYNLIYGNMQIDTKPKFTLRTLLFALLLIIDALGCTAFAATIAPNEAPSLPSSPVAEGNVPSARQTFSSIGSEVAQGLRDIPRVTTSTAGASTILGGVVVAATSAYTTVTGAEDAAGSSTQVEPQARIKELEEQVKELQSALEKEQNKTFFQRYLKCFGK